MMGQTVEGPSNLPVAVDKGLQRFCDRLEEILGDTLVSVILYGGLAKGDLFEPRSSDVNLLVVLTEVHVDILDRLSSPVRKSMRAFRLAPLVVNEHDLRTSTDVFPIKFLDMQGHHSLLRGRDVLSELTIEKHHLRLRCEQEIKNLLLRLRNVYLHGRPSRARIRATLASAISSFLHTLSAALVLKTGHSPTLKTEIAESAAKELELDRSALVSALALKRQKSRLSLVELKKLYDAFMVTVEVAADRIDRL